MNFSNIKLSIIIPCYNEENYIKKLIDELLEIVNPFEIIVVDDKSTDKSVEILKSINNPKIVIIKNDKNNGKGYCLRQGFNKAQGNVIVIQDADPEYSPKDIEMLIEPFSDPKTFFVIGTRFQTKYKRKIGYFYHTVFNKLITYLVNLKSNTNFTDIECGYKAFRKDILNDIKFSENRFGIEVEMIRKISKLKKNMYEVPVSYEMRSYTEGKKIGFPDAIAALYCLIKY